jgi:hypothetical protein
MMREEAIVKGLSVEMNVSVVVDGNAGDSAASALCQDRKVASPAAKQP